MLPVSLKNQMAQIRISLQRIDTYCDVPEYDPDRDGEIWDCIESEDIHSAILEAREMILVAMRLEQRLCDKRFEFHHVP